jgi:hypothetical protein
MDLLIFNETTIAEMREDLAITQKGAFWNKITPKTLNKIIAKIREYPYGGISANGGIPLKDGGKTTEIYISWYSWRCKKYVKCIIARNRFYHGADELGPKYNAVFNKEDALSVVFPERYEEYKITKFKRIARTNNIIVPQNIEYPQIIDLKKGTMMLIKCIVTTDTDSYLTKYLCSSVGYIEVGDDPGNIHEAMASSGIVLPQQLEDCTWEDIEPVWIMAQLRKL